MSDNLGWLNWFWQFLCEGLSFFNLKGFYYSCTWPCSFCEGRTSFCTGLISRKLRRFLRIFQLALLHSVSYFFFLYWSLASYLCTVFDSISFNIDKVLSINPSANVFVFGDFNSHHKDWLTYSGGTDRPGELCYNFSISNDLTQMANFPTWLLGSLTVTLLNVFPSDTSICSTMAFPTLWNSDHVVVSISIDFRSNSQQDALFHLKLTRGCPVSSHSLLLFSRWLRWSSWSFERSFMGGYL